MNECSAGFDLGTLSAQIATTDPGDATAWDTVAVGSDNSSVYDSTHALSGKAAKLVNGGTTGGDNANALIWSTALDGPLTDYYFRAYVYMENLPSAAGTTRLFQARNATDYCWTLQIGNDASIVLYNQAFAAIATFTNTMQTNAWTRFEGHTVHGTGDVEIKLFLNASSGIPTETQSVTGQLIRANTDAFAFSIGSLNNALWFDELICGATSYPGPIIESAPQVLSMQSHVFGHNMW